MTFSRLLPTALTLLGICGLCNTAGAVSDPVGIWTLSAAGTSRQCSVQFRPDPAATGQMIAMPPGCRRAFPILGTVRSWSVPDGVHLALNDENGVNVLMFAETGDGRLQAAGPEQEAAFILTALKPRHDPPVPVPAPAGETASPAVPTTPAVQAPPAPHRPVTVGATAGHYAVMRGSRDTGCMVTLEDGGRGATADLRARLAPACRDQGIIIFDPVGWSLKGGHLVLAARKGHTADFSEDGAGLWIRDAKTGQPLGLKRL